MQLHPRSFEADFKYYHDLLGSADSKTAFQEMQKGKKELMKCLMDFLDHTAKTH